MSDKNKSTTETADDSDRSPQVGALLRASRLRVGEDLREVSDNLCIRFLYLEAIEECRYEDLPGDTYAIGFIRSYAEHLGLDGEEVIRRYRLEKASGKRLSDLSFPTPVAESGVPKGAIVLVGVVLAVLVYGGWYATTTDDSILSDLISPVPERLQHLVGDENAQPAETNKAAPQSTTTSTNESSNAADQGAEGVNTETQEALQANTAEAIAEATEAARDNIENTNAAVSEVTTGTASPTVDAATNVLAETTDDVNQTATDMTDAAVSETANEASNVATTPEVTSSANDGTASNIVSTDTVVEPKPTPESQPSEVATSSDASSVPQEAADTEQANTPSAPVETTNEETAITSSAAAETSVEEPSPAPTPVVEQVSAEDLNAQSLQAAAGETTTGSQVEQPSTVASEQTSAAPEVASTTPVVAVQSSGIVVRAIDNSWVQITDPVSGEILFTGLMAPGVTFDVPARSGLLLDTGNAGAIDIIVNGNTVPKLGGEGTVRKGVALNAARLIAGTAAN